MNFGFDINQILPKRINKVTDALIPENFRGDRREYNDYQRLLTRILEEMGEASAKAQGLNKTITSALKLRDTDHIIYIMVDRDGNGGRGSIIGLLKTGSKTLFMFDENGVHYKPKPRCILDFYIHESCQRTGLGKELYEHMLAEENLRPIKLAIDRPSDKFLAFLEKHYGMKKSIPQNNQFYVFQGFFDDEIPESHASKAIDQSQLHNQMLKNNNVGAGTPSSKTNSINGSTITRSAYGRYAASHPTSTMADIIHHNATAELFKHRKRPQTSNIDMENNSKRNIENFEEEELSASTHQISLQNYEIEPPPDSQIIRNSVAPMSNNEENMADMVDEGNYENFKENTSADVDISISNLHEKECDDHQSIDGHLDLKFYHSPLW